MCDPVTATIAVIGAAGVGAYTQVQSSKSQARAIEQQGQAQQAVAEYNAEATENATEFNADVLEQNALIYEEAAFDSVERGVQEAAQKRLEFRQANARGRAAIASSGTVLDTGTNLDLLVNNAGFGEINALTIINNAEREAYGYKQEARNIRDQSAGARYTGELEAGAIRAGGRAGLISAQYSAANTRFAGNMGAIGTLAGGVSSAANLFSPSFRTNRPDSISRAGGFR